MGGLTTNWGFQDASQFDAQAGTISLSTFESLALLRKQACREALARVPQTRRVRPRC